MNRHPLIAIVGMDGIFPGAPDLDVFWTNILKGIDQSVPAPERRWIASPKDRLSDGLVPDRTYSRNACLIRDFDFDQHGFDLDPKVTRHLDPVHQLTLTAGKRAVKGCSIADIDPQRVDTILAAIALPTDSASAFTRAILGGAIARKLFPEKAFSQIEITHAQALASRVDGLPAALLAAEMGFGGNCFTLDAACASSTYAVKLACDALAFGRADMVVTGGVSRPECLYTQTGFSQLQALSRSGHCAPFDHRADGLVVGEGVGILVLKRLFRCHRSGRYHPRRDPRHRPFQRHARQPAGSGKPRPGPRHASRLHHGRLAPFGRGSHRMPRHRYPGRRHHGNRKPDPVMAG